MLKLRKDVVVAYHFVTCSIATLVTFLNELFDENSMLSRAFFAALVELQIV
jgi:hypothetical protein